MSEGLVEPELLVTGNLKQRHFQLLTTCLHMHVRLSEKLNRPSYPLPTKGIPDGLKAPTF